MKELDDPCTLDAIAGLACFSGLLDALEEEEEGDVTLDGTVRELRIKSHPGSAFRKEQRYIRAVAKRRLTRREERRRRRMNRAKNPISQQPLNSNLQIYIDFEFTGHMSDKEMGKLVRQMGRVWGLQKKTPGLQVTLLSPDDRFLALGHRKLTGFDQFRWIISERTVDEIAAGCRMVYLSPDSQSNALMDVRPDEAYIIGGLVDETGAGSLSLCKAEELGLDARRLPIQEFLQRRKNGTFNVMLTINQVVEILVRYVYSKDWVEALSVVPRRTGYEVVKLPVSY